MTTWHLLGMEPTRKWIKAPSTRFYWRWISCTFMGHFNSYPIGCFSRAKIVSIRFSFGLSGRQCIAWMMSRWRQVFGRSEQLLKWSVRPPACQWPSLFPVVSTAVSNHVQAKKILNTQKRHFLMDKAISISALNNNNISCSAVKLAVPKGNTLQQNLCCALSQLNHIKGAQI